MLSLKTNQLKLLFIVFISLFAIITTSCSDNDAYSFETMDDGGVTPGTRPKLSEKCVEQSNSEVLLIETKSK